MNKQKWIKEITLLLSLLLLTVLLVFCGNGFTLSKEIAIQLHDYYFLLDSIHVILFLFYIIGTIVYLIKVVRYKFSDKQSNMLFLGFLIVLPCIFFVCLLSQK